MRRSVYWPVGGWLTNVEPDKESADCAKRSSALLFGSLAAELRRQVATGIYGLS